MKPLDDGATLGGALVALIMACVFIYAFASAWLPWLHTRWNNMSSRKEQQQTDEMVAEPVHVPVPDTSMVPVPPTPHNEELPPMDWTRRKVVIFLATQKGSDGKPLSANDIADIMKGSRPEVLKWIREVRGS